MQRTSAGLGCHCFASDDRFQPALLCGLFAAPSGFHNSFLSFSNSILTSRSDCDSPKSFLQWRFFLFLLFCSFSYSKRHTCVMFRGVFSVLQEIQSTVKSRVTELSSFAQRHARFFPEALEGKSTPTGIQRSYNFPRCSKSEGPLQLGVGETAYGRERLPNWISAPAASDHSGPSSRRLKAV
jgi:hypothetical protein